MCIPGLIGEREGLGPNVLVKCLLKVVSFWESPLPEGVRDLFLPGFRFGRLFPGIGYFPIHHRGHSCVTPTATPSLVSDLLSVFPDEPPTRKLEDPSPIPTINQNFNRMVDRRNIQVSINIG